MTTATLPKSLEYLMQADDFLEKARLATNAEEMSPSEASHLRVYVVALDGICREIKEGL